MQEELLRQEQEGTFQSQYDHDVLSVALGTPEHSGRVRGIGLWITPAKFFPSSKRGKNKEESNSEQLKKMQMKLDEVTQRYEELSQHTGYSRAEKGKTMMSDSPPPSGGQDPDEV